MKKINYFIFIILSFFIFNLNVFADDKFFDIRNYSYYYTDGLNKFLNLDNENMILLSENLKDVATSHNYTNYLYLINELFSSQIQILVCPFDGSYFVEGSSNSLIKNNSFTTNTCTRFNYNLDNFSYTINENTYPMRYVRPEHILGIYSENASYSLTGFTKNYYLKSIYEINTDSDFCPLIVDNVFNTNCSSFSNYISYINVPKEQFTYTINYYFDDLLDSSKTIISGVEENTIINVTDYSSNYYILKEDTNLTYEITENNQVINIYYYSIGFGSKFSNIITNNIKSIPFVLNFDFLQENFTSIDFNNFTQFEKIVFTALINIMWLLFWFLFIYLAIKLIQYVWRCF